MGSYHAVLFLFQLGLEVEWIFAVSVAFSYAFILNCNIARGAKPFWKSSNTITSDRLYSILFYAFKQGNKSVQFRFYVQVYSLYRWSGPSGEGINIYSISLIIFENHNLVVSAFGNVAVSTPSSSWVFLLFMFLRVFLISFMKYFPILAFE